MLPTPLRIALLEAAALLVASGCGQNSASSCPGGSTTSVTPALACQIWTEDGFSPDGSTAGCAAACDGGTFCSVLGNYQPVEAGQCPAFPANQSVQISCGLGCAGGRMTAGAEPARPPAAGDEGARLAAMAYLEAVSVFSFERLARELTAHDAPAALVREARRARRDEVRHARVVGRLARRRGGRPRWPAVRAVPPARPLVEIAVENVVEGCVRETFGAVQGLAEARSSPDPVLRRAMARIADDECRHAELAWRVHAWAMPRLSSADRARVTAAAEGAVEPIAALAPAAAGRLFDALRRGEASLPTAG